MTKTGFTIVLLSATLVSGLGCAPALAQTRVFVAAQGSDANPCTFALPCRTFQHAHDAVAAGGEIDVLDPAGYGIVAITKAISIQGHGYAGIAASGGSNAITITAGPTDMINIRGVLLEGAGSGNDGIAFNSGASLNVQDCVIRNLGHYGINFTPNASSRLSVSTTVVSDMANSAIAIMPSGSGSVTAVLDHVEAGGAPGVGVGVLGGFSTGTVRVTVSNSVVSGSGTFGVEADSPSGHAATTVMVRNSTVANNAVGLFVNGAAATLRFTRSTITGNNSGWITNNGGTLSSYGDNEIDDNGSVNTAPAGTSTHK